MGREQLLSSGEGYSVFLQWFDSSPDVTILGELVLILRAKNILDEKNIPNPGKWTTKTDN